MFVSVLWYLNIRWTNCPKYNKIYAYISVYVLWCVVLFWKLCFDCILEIRHVYLMWIMQATLLGHISLIIFIIKSTKFISFFVYKMYFFVVLIFLNVNMKPTCFQYGKNLLEFLFRNLWAVINLFSIYSLVIINCQ